MKRLLALFATMAIIVSLFSGVVLAQPEHEYFIKLDQDKVIYREGFNYTTLTGRIVDGNGALVNLDVELSVYRDNGDGLLNPGDDCNVDSEVLGRLTDNGLFALTFLTDLGIGTYHVYRTDPGFTEESFATFTIMYAIELMEPTTLEWVWGDIPDTVIVQGMFTNEDNIYDAEDIYLYYQDENGAAFEFIAQADFANDSVFGFLFAGDDLFRTGKLGLYIRVTEDIEQVSVAGTGTTACVLALEGEVMPAVMNVTVSPMEAIVNLGMVKFTAEFDFDEMYFVEDDILAQPYLLLLEIDGPDGDAPWGFPPLNQYLVNQKVEEYLQLDGVEPGIYEFTFKLINVSWIGNGLSSENGVPPVIVVEEATIEVEALEPDEYNLVDWDDSAMKVGDNPFGFCPAATICQGTRPINVKDETGEFLDYLEVVFNGAGLDDFTITADNFEDMDCPRIIAPTETGIVEVTINVYEDINSANDGYETLLYTFTRELAVEGWNITITPNVVDVDSEPDITITITDEDGNPINNAIITSDLDSDGEIMGYGLYQEILFDGTVTNVVGGVYVIEYDDEGLDFKTVGFEDLEFWTEAQFEQSEDVVFEPAEDDEYTYQGAEIVMNEAIEVVGLDVYNVTCDTPVLLEGFEEEITVTPLDADGDVIYPVMTVTYYDADDKKVGFAEEFSVTRVDTNDDGVKESIKFDVTPAADAVKAVVRAESSDAKKYGEVELEVVKPQVVMTGVHNLTGGLENHVEFTMIDPRDNRIFTGDVYISQVAESDGYICALYDADEFINDGDKNDWFDKYLPENDDVYLVKVLPAIDYAAPYFMEQDDFDPADLMVELWLDTPSHISIQLMSIHVAEATLTATPSTVIIGQPQEVLLTYLDADEKPIQGYDVYLGSVNSNYNTQYDQYLTDSLVGQTDENGQVSYYSFPSSTAGLTFLAATEQCIEWHAVTAFVAVTPDMEPPTATLVEANGMATITITDNVRVQKAMVNGVLVDMFYPAPTVVHMLAQTDLYHVQAIDQNFNYLMVTLEGSMAHKLTVVIGQDCGGFGPAELVNEKTMVPVRYAEELGAVVTWDAPTASVTYTLNDGAIVITVQVGNTTAMVNGVAMEMAVAPYVNAQGRVMVPIRMIAQELGYTVQWVGQGTTYIY